MEFKELINLLYERGYFSSQAAFLKELLRNSVRSADKLSFADSTLKGYFSGNDITELADILNVSEFDVDLLREYIERLYTTEHKNTPTYNKKYGEKLYKDIILERSKEAFGDKITSENMSQVLSDKFNEIVDTKIKETNKKKSIPKSESAYSLYTISADEKKSIENICSLIEKSLDEAKRYMEEIEAKQDELKKVAASEGGQRLKVYLESCIKSAEEKLCAKSNELEKYCNDAVLMLELKKHLLSSLNDIFEIISKISEQISENVKLEYAQLTYYIYKYRNEYKKLLREIDKV